MAEDPLKKAPARIFLAIPLDEIFHHEIENLLLPLRREISGVRWSGAGQIHMTLHFFGAVSRQEIELIHLSSQKIASLFSPLKLSLDRIGGFPGLEKPDIIWLGVEEPSGRLLSLQKAIEGEVRTLGFKTEARAFEPHVTLGRVKWKSQELKPLLAKIPSGLPTPEKTVDHFSLYQSHYLPEGVRYEILKTYSLSKKV
jgi:RNA 2',3'-cyclic 3'-phosphodiesterase